VPIRAPEGSLGDLWIGRTAAVPYTGRDRGYLVTLSDLASIAIINARLRESEQQGAIVAERERIAREMHDSLAQVLGVSHLRLRALGIRPQVMEAPQVAAELTELADLTEEAYRDVREAILGLRESSRVDRGLIEGLHAYLEKYSHQAGVHATLETSLERELALPPSSEVQVIRVIQEALTNVRKHSGASSAVVRISDDDDGTTIVVEDNGRGFDLTGTLFGRDGFGLHTMRERMELIGGTLTIDAAPGKGTRVVAQMPGIPFAPVTPVEVNGAGNGTHPDPPGR
jgi:two-component system nitrate/nitrite sensor histidine kinase NarX